MRQSDCLRALAERQTNELVVCTLGRTAGQWFEAKRAASSSDAGDTFFMRSSMGLVSSFALGLALALPHRRIWAFDGDGALAMNLSTVLTMSAVRPANLLHIVWFNGQYEITGNQSMGVASDVSFEEIMRGAGARNTTTVRRIDDFDQEVDGLLKADDYAFMVAEVEPSEHLPDNSPRFPADMAYEFARYVERSENKPILDYPASLTR